MYIYIYICIYININLLDNVNNEPPKSRTKNWIEVNDNIRKRYNTYSPIKFKITILRPWDYNDVYIILKGIITGAGTNKDARHAENLCTIYCLYQWNI